MDNKLAAKTAEALFGHELFPLPRAEEKTYTATELGDIFGVTANKIGRITNDFNLKTKNTVSGTEKSQNTPAKK